MIKKFSSATGIFRVVWCSQYSGDQNCESYELPVRIAPDMQRMSILYENLVAKLTFINITYLMHFKTFKKF